MSTAAKDEKEKGFSTNAVMVGMGFIVLLGLMIGAYVVIMDRLNGDDAYRTKQLLDRGESYKVACEFNALRLQSVQEWIRQNNYKPPPDLTVGKPCVEQRPIEQPREK